MKKGKKKRDETKKEKNAKGIAEGNSEKKEEIEEQKKGESERNNKVLKTIFISMGIILFFLAIMYFLVYSQSHFNYNGAVFTEIKESSQLTVYQTSIPVLYQGKTADYNFYIRTNPDELKSIDFDGKLVLLKNVVLNMSGNIDCDGDEVIAIANLVKLYEILGAKMIKDSNASCDTEGKYMYLNIKEGNETNVEQFGTSCYNLNFKDCEILKTTEKFMAETFAEIKEIKGY